MMASLEWTAREAVGKRAGIVVHHRSSWIALLLVVVALPLRADEPAVGLSAFGAALVEHATGSPDGSTAFTFVRDDFRGETKDLPIGVFDSGIGGLTVLEAILALDVFDNGSLRPTPDGIPDFAGERFVYFGDQANMPYGNYPREGNEEYLRELILKDAIFLLGRRRWPAVDAAAPLLDKPPVKAIVIACNTATAYGLGDVRAAITRWGIPVFVVGVVEAGARGVLELDRSSGGLGGAVAILATVGTCASDAYPRAIATAFGRAGRRGPQVVQRGSADLAAVIEGAPTVAGGTTAERVIAADIRGLMDDYRRSGATRPVASVVLGCTHYPLVRDQILAELATLRRSEEAGARPFAALIADRIEVVDPAEMTARELFRTLALQRLRAGRTKAAAPKVGRDDLFFISVPHGPRDGAARRDRTFARKPGCLGVEDVRIVPMGPDLLTASSLNLIRTRLPHVWRSLGW